jgi:hypothetical protein
MEKIEESKGLPRYIPSRSQKRYDILSQGRNVIIRRLANEVPYKVPYELVSRVGVGSAQVVATKITGKEFDKKVHQFESKIPQKEKKEIIPDSEPAPIANAYDWKDLQQKVKKLREEDEKNQVKKPENAQVENAVCFDEKSDNTDAEDLANGKISNEQELITSNYLDSLSKKVLRRMYYVATGNKAKEISNFEVKKTIMDKYKTMSASKKEILFESSKFEDK